MYKYLLILFLFSIFSYNSKGQYYEKQVENKELNFVFRLSLGTVLSFGVFVPTDVASFKDFRIEPFRVATTSIGIIVIINSIRYKNNQPNL